MCLVAHPDDETILCGGTLALLAGRGVAVHVVCLTRGEGGEVGEPPRATREQLGDVREQEMVNAVRALGGKSLTFLGYVDPTFGPDEALFAPEHDPALLAGQIINCVKQFKPQVLLTHGSNGEYGHPAHKLLHAMSRVAVASLIEEKYAPVPEWWSFAAAYPAHP
jgi:N-acetyl-1-D-myo-inositol-2-amino-2-deoxy-alpha-D-glucopyranoside deacetylase